MNAGETRALNTEANPNTYVKGHESFLKSEETIMVFAIAKV
jgi:hypothetical protein